MVRVTKETRPWGDGGKQMTRKVYAANFSRFYDACFMMAYIQNLWGTCVVITDWSFLFCRYMVDWRHAGNIRTHFSGLRQKSG